MRNNYNLKFKHEIAGNVHEGNNLNALNEVRSSDCALSIYNRHLDNSLTQWLDDLPPENLPEARITSLKLEDVRNTVLKVCKSFSISNEGECDALANDIEELAKAFAQLMKMDKVNLRLDVVDDDACRRFHQDNVAARLICTYRGRGTEYGTRSNGESLINIKEVPRGSAAVFKGRLWHHSISSSVFHRSPQIEGTGETRLLLVIDPFTECSDDNCC